MDKSTINVDSGKTKKFLTEIYGSEDREPTQGKSVWAWQQANFIVSEYVPSCNLNA